MNRRIGPQVKITLPPDIIAIIDDVRGRIPRSAFCRKVLIAIFAESTIATPMVDQAIDAGEDSIDLTDT